MKFLLLLLPLSLFAHTNLVLSIPESASVTVIVRSNPPPPALPLSVQMRQAAQLAKSKAAPWTQRFIVVSSELHVVMRIGEDENGRPNALYETSTNWLVSALPIADQSSNAPCQLPHNVWGPNRNQQFQFWTLRPTRRGDEFELFPIQ